LFHSHPSPRLGFIFTLFLCVAGARADEPSSRPATTCRTARECFLTGQYDEARRLYEAMAAKDSLAVIAAIGLADVDRAVGEYASAKDRLTRGEARGKSSPDWHVALAAALTETGEYQQAIALLEAALKIDPHHLRAACDLGAMLETLGRYAEARRVYERFDDRMTEPSLPPDAEALLAIGRGFYRFSVLSRHPDLVQRTRHVLTEVYQEIFDFLDGQFWPARLAAADLLREKHQLPEAREDYLEILNQNPQAAAAHVGLGELALEDWNFDEAIARAESALKVNPRFVAAHVLLARIRMTERKYREAAAHAEDALKTNPRHVEALSLLGAAQLRAGDDRASLQTQKRIEDTSPNSALWHYTFGVWLVAARQYDEAECRFKKAIAADPSWPEPLTQLGQLYMETGEEESARQTLESSFALDRFNRRTHNVLELLDQLDRFARVETEHFIVKYDAKEDAVAAPYLVETLERIHADLCKLYGVTLKKKTILELFPDHLGFSVRITGRPFIATVGACTGRVIALTAPRGRPPFGAFNWASVLRHEFTHTVTLAATRNRIPHWLTEGLAVRAEPVPRPWHTKLLLASAIQHDRLFDLESIDWGFMRPRDPTDRPLAYAQSEWMIEYLIGRWGDEAMARLLAAFRDGANQEAVFQAVLKIEPKSFSEAFKAWAVKQVEGWGLPVDPIEPSESLLARAKESPEDAELLAKLARSLLTEDNPESAELAARKALKREPKQELALTVLGSLLVSRMMEEKDEAARAEQVDEVEPILRRLLEVSPGSGTGMKYLGFAEQEKGRLAEAATWLKKYQAKYPEDPDSYRRLSGIHLHAGRVEQALAQLEKLYALEEDEAAVARQVGRIYADRKDWSAAARWHRQAIDIDPYDAATHEALAEAAYHAGDLKTAEREYQAVCALRPAEAIGYDGLARVYRAMDKPDEARKQEEKARSLSPAAKDDGASPGNTGKE
jgi:tetratricopeptide (TPR) repeat protein